MNYHLVIHTVASFLQHDDMVGYEGESIPKEFEAIRPGDRVVYYCKGDGVITGTYRVVVGPRIVRNDAKWEGPHTIVKSEKLLAGSSLSLNSGRANFGNMSSTRRTGNFAATLSCAGNTITSLVQSR